MSTTLYSTVFSLKCYPYPFSTVHPITVILSSVEYKMPSIHSNEVTFPLCPFNGIVTIPSTVNSKTKINSLIATATNSSLTEMTLGPSSSPQSFSNDY